MYFLLMIILFIILKKKYKIGYTLAGILSISIFIILYIILFTLFIVGVVGLFVFLSILLFSLYYYYKSLYKNWNNIVYAEKSLYERIDSLINKVRLLDKNVLLFEEIPYNRSQYFSMGSELNYSDDVFPIVYDAKPTTNEMTFQEYGYLVTTNELIIKNQIKNSEKDSINKYAVQSYFIKFQDLANYLLVSSTLILFYYKEKPVIVSLKREQIKPIKIILNEIINSGWTKYIDKIILPNEVDTEEFEEFDKKINLMHQEFDKEYKSLYREKTNDSFIKITNLSQFNPLVDELHANQINARFSASQGHGHVAEQFGNAYDRFIGKNAKPLGSSNEKGGADRLVNNVNIQTKFCKTARLSIDQCFDGKKAKYISNGKMMKIEVPKDQYAKAVEIMEIKIKKGLVPNENNPNNARKYVKKSPITYEQAHIASKSIFDRKSEIPIYDKYGKKTGTRIVTVREKLIYSAGGDFLTGASVALPSAMVLGVWVYCNSIWNGESKKNAFKNASLSTMKPIFFSGFTYMLASQFAGSQVGKKVGDSISKTFIKTTLTNRQKTELLTKNSSFVITAAVTVGPDVYKCLSGKISSNQLIKNTTTASIGAVTGIKAGAALGSFIPGLGTIVGSVVGGTAGAIGSKIVLDKFIEDDAVQMLRIAKEEFINTIIMAELNREEFDFILKETFMQTDFNKVLKLMYANENPREFIHQIYFALINKVYEQRVLPSDDELIEVIQLQEFITKKQIA